jgi:hypothetical protein
MAVATNGTDSEVVYRTRHDRDDGPVSEAIVKALAAVENVEPTDLDVRLYDSVDPEALDRLYETAAERSERLEVSFTIGGYVVVVTGVGDILVSESSEPRTEQGRPSS